MKRIFIALLLLSSQAFATTFPQEYPNPAWNWTPGAVDSAKTAKILCAAAVPESAFFPTYPQSILTAMLTQYGISAPTCTYDRLSYSNAMVVPLQLGGTYSQSNTWPQKNGTAYYTPARKNELDWYLYSKVCDKVGTPMPLPTAQNYEQNWRASYKALVNTQAPTPAPTVTGLPTAINTYTNTPTITNTPTVTNTPTPTNTRTNTPTNTATVTNTPTATPIP